ncbi:MAG TPA: glycosyltransferase [Pyrinomonadaceae bacterium]
MQELRPFISVIVPVYNGGKFIGRCIDALLSNRYPRFEVIVVNDGSTDNGEEICRAKGVTVLQSERPRSGPAAARNFAAAQAKHANILMFVDADVVVEHDTVAKVAQCFERDAGIAAFFGSYDDSPAEKNFLSQYKNLQHHFVHQTSNPEASTFWAGLGAVRADIFRSVGGFDCERFAVPSIEDIELGARLRQASHRILLERSIQAKHLKKWTVMSLLRTDIFCRAVPWSRLILTSQGLINDMNLKTNDRASAALAGMIVLLIPLSIWQPVVLLAIAGVLAAFVYLNRRLLSFYMDLKGPIFAAAAVPWQMLYFLYSGFTFVACWFIYYLPILLGISRDRRVGETRS